MEQGMKALLGLLLVPALTGSTFLYLVLADTQPATVEPGKPVTVRVSSPDGSVTIRIEVVDGAKPLGKLEKELADLYRQDSDPDKTTHARALGQLYQWAAKTLRAVDLDTVGTAGEFRKALGTRSGELLPANVLLPLRQRVQVELRTVLPSKSGAPLDEKTRKAAADLFDWLAIAMNQIVQ